MKRYRIMKIKEIIQNQVIETQEELAAALKKEGIVVTQATVSRDIKELMLIKVPYKDRHYRYALSDEKAVTKIDSSMNLVVLHTIPGSASAVAFAIDHANSDVVIGTLAGDDTILIILKSPEDVPVFLEHIQGLLKS